MKRLAAFTLLELLTVIVIIIVLASILFASFASAKESAKSASCLSNERQVAMALSMYIDSNSAVPSDDPIPWEVNLGLPTTSENGIQKPALRCPDYLDTDAYGVPGPNANQKATGYALNECTFQSIRVDSSKTVLLTEVSCINVRNPSGGTSEFCMDIMPFPDTYYSLPGYSPQSGGTNDTPVGSWGAIRHHGRSHFAMVDGHVATLSPDQIAVPKENICNVNPTQWFGPASGPTFATMTSIPGE